MLAENFSHRSRFFCTNRLPNIADINGAKQAYAKNCLHYYCTNCLPNIADMNGAKHAYAANLFALFLHKSITLLQISMGKSLSAKKCSHPFFTDRLLNIADVNGEKTCPQKNVRPFFGGPAAARPPGPHFFLLPPGWVAP